MLPAPIERNNYESRTKARELQAVIKPCCRSKADSSHDKAALQKSKCGSRAEKHAAAQRFGDCGAKRTH